MPTLLRRFLPISASCSPFWWEYGGFTTMAMMLPRLLRMHAPLASPSLS